MTRRPPMKIASSPSDTPEHDAVRERERSSEAVQAKIREERAIETTLKSKNPPTLKAAATAPKRAKPKQVAEAATKAAEPISAATSNVAAPAKRVEQRISVGVPISLSTSNALDKAATKLGTDIDYIKRALAPKARAAFLERASANDLKTTSKSMKLLFEQRTDNAVSLMPGKLVVDEDIEAKVRAYISDPLDVISVNRLVAAFVGAEFEVLVATL